MARNMRENPRRLNAVTHPSLIALFAADGPTGVCEITKSWAKRGQKRCSCASNKSSMQRGKATHQALRTKSWKPPTRRLKFRPKWRPKNMLKARSLESWKGKKAKSQPYFSM
jgi:hypothetical protein